MKHRTPLLCALALVSCALAMNAAPAHATSGFGCYRANVGANDPLAIRSEPTARSDALMRVHAGSSPIIALDGLPRGEGVEPSLFDVHRTEMTVCVPNTLPLGARWCPVTLFDGDQVRSGWAKRRFLDHSECP